MPAILATVQGFTPNKNKKERLYKGLDFYVLDTAIGIVTLILGTTVATNRALVITFCACSFACFFATAFMFGSTIKALSATYWRHHRGHCPLWPTTITTNQIKYSMVPSSQSKPTQPQPVFALRRKALCMAVRISSKYAVPGSFFILLTFHRLHPTRSATASSVVSLRDLYRASTSRNASSDF